MHNGFIKVACASVDTIVANPKHNTNSIIKQIKKADEVSANLLVLPELCLSGYTCQDLFLNDTLINNCISSLAQICEFTNNKFPVVVLGLPVNYKNGLYNCAAVIHNGKILGIVPKSNIPVYSNSYEGLYFNSANTLPDVSQININGKSVPFGKKIIFEDSLLPIFKFGIALGEDLFSTTQNPCLAGATIVAAPVAKNEIAETFDTVNTLLAAESLKFNTGIVYSSCNCTESTQDYVFSGKLAILENGNLLSGASSFQNVDFLVSEIDVQRMLNYRKKSNSFNSKIDEYQIVSFAQAPIKTQLTRKFSMSPFLPSCNKKAEEYAEKVLNIQTYGLKKRIEHTNAKSVVLGVSGGLDSTLSLLVAIRTMKLLCCSNDKILAITMPCFGTTHRTRSNAEQLCELLGVSFKCIDISNSVTSHLNDISHPANTLDATYENAQARERTQVLMDIANEENGFVIGTGDLSELALGWATYNGDHMSMYSLNASLPKTLIQYIVKYEAEHYTDQIKDILLDIVATPISPELLPASNDDEILQKTEDFVGPYELHDFFIYHMLDGGCSPKKLYLMATNAFDDKYDGETIKKWLKVFVRRFFTQQFKRSCMPDGPKATCISLSPRGGLRMPSDASYQLWLDEINEI